MLHATWGCIRSKKALMFYGTSVVLIVALSGCMSAAQQNTRTISEGAIVGGMLGTSLYSPSNVCVSRIFAGPAQYPPKDFAAYGIVAFPSAPTS